MKQSAMNKDETGVVAEGSLFTCAGRLVRTPSFAPVLGEDEITLEPVNPCT